MKFAERKIQIQDDNYITIQVISNQFWIIQDNDKIFIPKRKMKKLLIDIELFLHANTKHKPK